MAIQYFFLHVVVIIQIAGCFSLYILLFKFFILFLCLPSLLHFRKMLEVLKQQKHKVVSPVRSCDLDKHSVNVSELSYAIFIKLNVVSAKATAGRRVSSQLINARHNVRKTRVSDGFVQT